jgi:hypothetical protein
MEIFDRLWPAPPHWTVPWERIHATFDRLVGKWETPDLTEAHTVRWLDTTGGDDAAR